MTNEPVKMLTKLAHEHNVTLETRGGSQVMSFIRSGLIIEVTVPFDVLEWFINVSNSDGSASMGWWCDYCGYDKTPLAELASRMASDIDKLVSGLGKRQLRLIPLQKSRLARFLRSPTQHQLDWLIDGQWEEALLEFPISYQSRIPDQLSAIHA